MKQTVLLLFALLISILSASAARQEVDYALISATPYTSETNLGRTRLDKFLAKNNLKKQALLAQTPIVAVQAASLTAGEVGTIMRRLNSGNARGITTGYRQMPADSASREVKFLLLFDTRTRELVTDDGVLVIDTPGHGKVGTFGGYSAIYIGTGY